MSAKFLLEAGHLPSLLLASISFAQTFDFFLLVSLPWTLNMSLGVLLKPFRNLE